MTADEVRAIIAGEIGAASSLPNSHGIDLKRCLVIPRRVSCRNSFSVLNDGKPIPLWIVLEERPGSPEGYLIVFDDRRRVFGLADWDGITPVFLGFYGTFLNALQGM